MPISNTNAANGNAEFTSFKDHEGQFGTLNAWPTSIKRLIALISFQLAHENNPLLSEPFMSITITDDRLAVELSRAKSPVDVRTADGRQLGVFTPIPQKCPEPNISEEELRRREDTATGKWFTAAEVEAKLRELRCSQ